MKKLISLLLVIFLAACAVAATPATPPGPPPPSLAPPEDFASHDDIPDAAYTNPGTTQINWLIPVLMRDYAYEITRERIDAMTSIINMELAPHELSLHIELMKVTTTPIGEVFPDDGYKRYIISPTEDMMALLSDPKNYHLISLPTAHVQVTQLIDAGLLRNIASDLNSYENLAGALDADQLEAMRYIGGIYGVPSGFDVRKSLSQAYLGIEAETLASTNVATYDVLTGILDASKQAQASGAPHTVYFGYRPEVYRREYPQFPFKVSDDFMFVYTADGGVEAYTNSAISRQDADVAKRIWEANGDAEARFTWRPETDRLMTYMADQTFEFVRSLSDIDDGAEDYTPVLLAPESPRILYDNPFGKILTVIPTHAPAYGLKLLDIIYGNPELYDLFRQDRVLFGEFELAPASSLSHTDPGMALLYDYSPTRGHNLYAGSSSEPRAVRASAIRHEFYEHYHFTLFDCVRQPALDPLSYAEAFAEALGDTGYTPMPWDGFTFDPAPVEETYTKVYERMWGWLWARLAGVGNRTFDFSNAPLPSLFFGQRTHEDIANVNIALYEYGMETVLEECRRQYAQFLAQKGWIAPAPSN